MKLIKKIEINYLRSLYSATLDSVGDLNVIFGRNDSGKSNLLRALNLFFNNETDANRYFDFDLDMSDPRKQEARDAKGRQFIWVKITFNVPHNYRGVLGEEIAIKRQWNRDGEVNTTIFPNLETAGQQSRLTRFLNDIDFTYIPAIKDLTVYADLIERMYAAAAETATLEQATSQFIGAIESQTTSLSEQLSSLFGAPAHLAPPTEMSQLFRNLDFAHGDDGHSLLRQKGDGVKARHLPELLSYINQNEPRKKLYLWGFEEPENSLDLGAAELEARRFASFAEQLDTQIFITSHSPAFYLADESNSSEIRRYFISKQQKNEEGEMLPRNASSLIDRIADAETKMAQAGLLQLPFVIRRMGEQRRELQEKATEAETLRSELASLRKPTLYVEGPHDVGLFQSAFDRIGVNNDVSVKALGGTPQTTEGLLSAVLQQGGLNAAALTLFLFDDDKAGRAAYRKLCNGTPQDQPKPYEENMLVWAIQRTEDFNRFTRRNSINRDQAFFTAEFLYPVNEASQICADLVAAYPDQSRLRPWLETINGDYWPGLGQQKCARLQNAEFGSEDWFFARGVPSELKAQFAERAIEDNISTESIDEIARTVWNSLSEQV
ncbi:MAG: ATP-dependent nuclease [Labrenzia sp.]